MRTLIALAFVAGAFAAQVNALPAAAARKLLRAQQWMPGPYGGAMMPGSSAYSSALGGGMPMGAVNGGGMNVPMGGPMAGMNGMNGGMPMNTNGGGLMPLMGGGAGAAASDAAAWSHTRSASLGMNTLLGSAGLTLTDSQTGAASRAASLGSGVWGRRRLASAQQWGAWGMPADDVTADAATSNSGHTAKPLAGPALAMMPAGGASAGGGSAGGSSSSAGSLTAADGSAFGGPRSAHAAWVGAGQGDRRLL